MVLGFRKNAVVEPTVTPTELGSESEKHEGNVIAQSTAIHAQDELKTFEKLHAWDPNLPQDTLDQVHQALKIGDAEQEVALESVLIADDSPYAEVRAAVRNYDTDVPANTIRAWVLGMLWATIGSGVNMLFSLRSPSVYLTPIVIQLVSYPMGVFWAYIMPTKEFNTFGVKWSLNRGPFNMKEHTLIVIMANASFGGTTAYSTDVLLAQEIYYGQKFGWAYQLLLTLTCQLLGLGIAGLTRKWLVEPAAMIWPATLVNTTFFETLHKHGKPDPAKTNGWTIGRYKYFLIVFAGIFVWEWFPLWIAPILSTFTFICWAAPNNVVVNQLFGGQTGLTLLPITFDWTVISGYLTSPIMFPFHAIANTMVGLVVFVIITCIGVHYTGGFYSQYLPMSTGGSFDNTGAPYNVSLILTEDYTLDPVKYSAYSPLFLSTTFAISYGLSFATIIALVVHTYLYNGNVIWQRVKASRGEDADIHQKLMMKYKEAPWWWYLISFAIMFALGLVTCLVWETNLTWWAFIVSLIIAIVFYVPIGMIQAVTNVQIGLNVITEFIIGYMQPGRPLAMMMFKMYGYITMYQGMYFTQDIKLAHYMKVPQRTTFWAQAIATIWSCIVQIAVYNWALGNIKDVCTPDQENGYNCPNAHVFFTASIIWGLIGPANIFGPGSVYYPLLFFFIIGLTLPVIVYFAARRWPKSPLRYINMPIVFGGTGNIPPATVLIYASWGMVGTLFNKYIKNKFPGWWSEYTYVTSAALDSGMLICTIVIFFCLQLPDKVSPPQWWGGFGGGFMDNVDWNGTPQVVLDEGTFGPASW